MNRQETMLIMAAMQAAYPRFYIDKTKEEMKQAVDLWTSLFADDKAEVVTEAVKAMIITLKYPPTIADVKERIRLITALPQMSEFEAWNVVFKAISNSCYNSGAEFEKLPQNIQRLVGSP